MYTFSLIYPCVEHLIYTRVEQLEDTGMNLTGQKALEKLHLLENHSE